VTPGKANDGRHKTGEDSQRIGWKSLVSLALGASAVIREDYEWHEERCDGTEAESMRALKPGTTEELAAALREWSGKRRRIELAGNHSKRLMAGPVGEADIAVTTAGLRRVLRYEPNDLTISVEAGMPFAELQSLLAGNRQMVALDPPFAGKATVGGVVAANASGPLRRHYGTVRDLIIGMQFVLLDGRVVRTGGMVVKNVAGLDMGKLMIGSFGTLAAITSVNFRVHPLPEETRTFLFSFSDSEAAVERRDAIHGGALQPLAVDLLSPPAAARLGARGYVLAVRAGGSRRVLARYARELAGSEQIADAEEKTWWMQVQEFTGEFLRRQPSGVVLRIGTKLKDLGALLRVFSGTSISRAATGVTYVYLTSWQGVAGLWREAQQNAWNAAVEYAPDESRVGKELWLDAPGEARVNSFDMMKKVKMMFDPDHLLNRARLYGRI
jgi:glycolate oxidase FAD binding subunit